MASTKEKAGHICDICDGWLSHPNVLELEDNPKATLDDYRYAIEIAKENLLEIWHLAGEIYSETQEDSAKKP